MRPQVLPLSVVENVRLRVYWGCKRKFSEISVWVPVALGLVLIAPILPPVSMSPVLAQSVGAEVARLNQQAIQLYQQYQFEAALDAFQQVLQIVRQMGDRIGEAKTLTNLGQVHESLEQYPQALNVYEEALAISREMDDRTAEGEILDKIGSVYSSSEQYDQAWQFYQRALTVRREAGDRAGEQVTLNNLGFILSRRGEYGQALDLYQQSLGLAREVGDRAGEGVALNNIGWIYTAQGNYPQALETYQQSLTIRRELGDRAGEATLLNNIGSIYDTLGQYPPALDYYERAIVLLRQVGNRLGEATTLSNIGLIYNILEQYDQALNYYQQSLALRQATGDRTGQGISLNNIGGIYNSQGQYAEALPIYQQALAIARELNDASGEGTILGNLGVLYDNLGQPEQALEFYQQALRILRELGDRRGQATTLSNVGLLLSKQNQPELAIAFYKQSVNITEAIRQDIQTLPPEMQQSYTATVAENYRRLADLLLQQDRVFEAQQVLDLLKLQELDDFLQNIQEDGQPAQRLEYWQPEQQLLTLFDQATNQSFATFLTNPDVAVQIDQLRRIARGQNLNPAQLDSLQDNLRQLQQPAVLLYPLLLDNRLELVLITPNAPPIRRTVMVSREEVSQTIARFRMLTTLSSNPLNQAKQLYQWLIQPIRADLDQAGAETIVYAADGQLRYLPLAALHDGNQWLIQQFRINQITAASLTNFDAPGSTDLRVLAAAFSDPQQSYAFQVGTRGFNFAGLRFAGVEVQNIATAIPNTTQLFNQEFSRAMVEPRMNNYAIVHLATHAEFVPGHPEDSFILFGNGDRVTLQDVATWNLPDVDLVVLSACRTAVSGELGNGEEILGFGYQVQRTGARAAIASLWYVDDGGTQVLMNAFYAALRRGNISNAEALRQAQIALITGNYAALGLSETTIPEEAEVYSRPYYWAPFILIGNGL